ncbi:sterol carrier protein 2, variant 2 [Balamuthia mandrillaris]
MGERVFVVGVGLTKFEKAQKGQDYPEMARAAIGMALQDAGLRYEHVEAVVAGYCYGEPTCGQRVAYEMGLTGVPVVNVNNNCSTGSTALFVARNFVKGGVYECALAVGFEKMEKNLSQKYTDSGYTSPVARHFDYMFDCGSQKEPIGKLNDMTSNVIKMFGDAAVEHQQKYGTTDKQFAIVAWKNHKHSVNNPYAQLQREFSLETIMSKDMHLYGPLTLYQACPTGDGSAAAIVCSEAFVKKHNLQEHAVEILSQTLVTDLPSSFDQRNKSFINLCGFEMVQRGAAAVFRESGLTPRDVDVLEVRFALLHRWTSIAVLTCYHANRCMTASPVMKCWSWRLWGSANLAPVALWSRMGKSSRSFPFSRADLPNIKQRRWVSNKEGGQLYQVGGRWVVNPSGGLESKGHPIGATGLAQCAELCWQVGERFKTKSARSSVFQ